MSMQDDTLILFSGLPDEEIHGFINASLKKSERAMGDTIAEYFYPKCPLEEIVENKEAIREWYRDNTSCSWTKWGYEIIDPPSNMGRIKFNFALSAECCGAPVKEVQAYVDSLKEKYKELDITVIIINWFEDRDSAPAELYTIMARNEEEW